MNTTRSINSTCSRLKLYVMRMLGSSFSKHATNSKSAAREPLKTTKPSSMKRLYRAGNAVYSVMAKSHRDNQPLEEKRARFTRASCAKLTHEVCNAGIRVSALRGHHQSPCKPNTRCTDISPPSKHKSCDWNVALRLVPHCTTGHRDAPTANDSCVTHKRAWH